VHDSGVAAIFEIGGSEEREVLLVGNGENDAPVLVLEHVREAVAEQPRHDHVTALDQPQLTMRAPG